MIRLDEKSNENRVKTVETKENKSAYPFVKSDEVVGR